MDSDLEPVALTPQKQDSAWKHCEVYKYGDRLQMRCLYCHKMFKGGGITRVKEHLAGKKGQGTICDQVPEEVRLFLQQCIDGTVRRQRKRPKTSPEPLPIAYFPPPELETQVVDPSSDVNNGFTSQSSELVAGQSTGRTKQRTYRSRKNNAFDGNDFANVEVGGVNSINDFIGRDMDNLIPVVISSVKNILHPSSKDLEKTAHMALGRFLFDIGADFDAVDSLSFQPFMDAILSGGFGVSVPTHEDLRGWILKSCVEEMKKEIDECKPLWKKTGCSVLVQELNSPGGPKILNFLVYCPEKVVFLKSVDSSDMLASDDKLYELLKEVVEDIGNTNVVQVITKCEDHYVTAGKKLMHVYPSLYWVPCAAHCIDKMLEEFGKIDWISEIIEQARTVTRIIYNHSGVLNLMRKFTVGNDIVQPALTSSATNFATMGRLADLKPHLQAMVTSSEWNDCSYSKEAGGLAMAETISSDESFWKALTLANRITVPILRVLKIVCSEKKPAMGYVYAALYRVKEAIKTNLVHKEDYTIYWKIIDKWWLQQHRLPLHAAGFYLNPKFFYSIGEEMRSEIHLAVVDCIEKLVPDDNIQDIIIKDINSYKNAVGIFGRNLTIRARDTMLPAEWWSTYGESCLNLSRFAIRILSQTCSSLIGHGRRLTTMEKIYETKNSIERQRLSDLVFVQYNMRLKRMGCVSGDDPVDPLSQSNMEVLEDWVSRNQVCIEGDGSSDWKSLESIKRTEEVVAVIDETEDLGSGFDDAEIFKGEKEVSDEGGYYTNISEKLFT